MNQSDQEFSTQKITPQLVEQIIESLKNKAYGSVEIYVENFKVVQITQRTITKLNNQNGNGHKKVIHIKNGQFSYQKTKLSLWKKA